MCDFNHPGLHIGHSGDLDPKGKSMMHLGMAILGRDMVKWLIIQRIHGE